MSRRLPLCAWCGEPLRRKAHIRITYDAFPGKPETGWHVKSGTEPDLLCFDADPFGVALLGENRKDMEKAELRSILEDIERRGSGRLVANKAWGKR